MEDDQVAKAFSQSRGKELFEATGEVGKQAVDSLGELLKGVISKDVALQLAYKACAVDAWIQKTAQDSKDLRESPPILASPARWVCVKELSTEDFDGDWKVVCPKICYFRLLDWYAIKLPHVDYDSNLKAKRKALAKLILLSILALKVDKSNSQTNIMCLRNTRFRSLKHNYPPFVYTCMFNPALAQTILDLHPWYGLNPNEVSSEGVGMFLAACQTSEIALCKRVLPHMTDATVNFHCPRWPLMHTLSDDYMRAGDPRVAQIISFCCSQEVARNDGSGLQLLQANQKGLNPIEFVEEALICPPGSPPSAVLQEFHRRGSFIISTINAAISRQETFARGVLQNLKTLFSHANNDFIPYGNDLCNTLLPIPLLNIIHSYAVGALPPSHLRS